MREAALWVSGEDMPGRGSNQCKGPGVVGAAVFQEQCGWRDVGEEVRGTGEVEALLDP